MKTDLLLIPMGARWADLRGAAAEAEDAGFDGLWTWDHLRDPEEGGARVPEAWTVLSALASATSRVALGPLVLNVSSRHPGILANMAATLQEVSGGRLVLGIGAGAHRRMAYAEEYRGIGLDVPRDPVRAARVAEACQVLRRLWAGDAAAFEGEHYRLARPTGFLRPDPPPPIVVGGFGPRMAGIAGRHADGFNTQAAHPRLAELVATARAERAASGRDPAGLLVTAFAGWRDAYLDPSSAARASLGKAGVERLILLIEPPYDRERIRAGGRLLARSG
jgi:alkanesulfonate monooxygenase SsuD/methylene tetrahydromethanopterin reductase-like flavin-dependent oxidoreductase (luciferase family)